jgi:uncharacterized damage-inducible protein DinB
MDARLAGCAQLFDTSGHYLRQSVRGLDGEQLRQRVGRANSILWTLGHITVGRLRLLTMLGDRGVIPWTKVVGRGADEVTHALPDPTEVFARWDDAARRLAERLPQLSEEELLAPARYTLPGSDGTMLGTINYFAFHEAYHIGQLAVIRKALNNALPRRTVDRLVAISS